MAELSQDGVVSVVEEELEGVEQSPGVAAGDKHAEDSPTAEWAGACIPDRVPPMGRPTACRKNRPCGKDHLTGAGSRLTLPLQAIEHGGRTRQRGAFPPP